MCMEWLTTKAGENSWSAGKPTCCSENLFWFWQVQQKRSLRRNGISMMSMWTTRMWRRIMSICNRSWKLTMLTRRSTDGSMTRGTNRHPGGPGPDRSSAMWDKEDTAPLYLPSCLNIFKVSHCFSSSPWGSGSTVADWYESPWALCTHMMPLPVSWWSR